MPFQREITDEQLEQLHNLRAEGMSFRAIAAEIKMSKETVQYYVNKKIKDEGGKELSESVAAARDLVRSESVFDIVKGLEKCLYETETLLKMDSSKAPLRDKLAVRSELRALFREARETMESIHNIKLFHAFIETVASILARQDPTARERIYAELERCANEAGVTGLFGGGGTRQAKPGRPRMGGRAGSLTTLRPEREPRAELIDLDTGELLDSDEYEFEPDTEEA